MACPVVRSYVQNLNLNTHRQPSGKKIKMPFSIHIHPMLCKMNFISIIIIKAMRGHNGGKQTTRENEIEKKTKNFIVFF